MAYLHPILPEKTNFRKPLSDPEMSDALITCLYQNKSPKEVPFRVLHGTNPVHQSVG